MKKLGYISMFVAVMLLGACNNFEDFDFNEVETGGYVEPAGSGTEEDPYNVSKALLEQNNQYAWVKGYIVGQVAGADISTDSEFDAPFHGAVYDDGVSTIGTNILVAAKEDEKNQSACLIVQLPKGDLRTTLELLGNPDNDGKEVELYGKLTKYFGVAGMKETAAAKFDGTTIGQVPSTPDTPAPGPEGDGSENNPYNVTAAKANQNNALAWVKGFIVGQVAGSSINDESQFDAPFTGAVYDDGTVATAGTNVLIAATATESNASACLVVQLPAGDVRTALELLGHPENDGKEVALYGKLTKYFGVAGMKETAAAKFDGTTIGQVPSTPDTPVNPEEGEGNGTKVSPYNVSAVISLANVLKEGGPKAWVKAYIVGQVNGKSMSNAEWDAPFGIPTGSTQGTNILIADNVDDKTNVVPVQLPSGSIRNALSLPDNPDMDGKEVLLYGELVQYFGECGMKNTTCAIVDGVVYGVEPVDAEGALLEISFKSGLGDFTTYSVLGDEAWESDPKYGAKMAGFTDGSSRNNEDWLISPALSLSGKSNVVLTFEHAINKGDLANLKTNHTLWISKNYAGGNPNDATWEQVEIPAYPNGTSWDFVSSGDVVLPAAYMDNNVRFAFKYLSSDSESATWEIRNLVVK